MYSFNTPEQKKNKCYISQCNDNINLCINEVKIKNIKQMSNSKGYIITCYIPEKINTDTINTINKIDEDAYNAIIKNNHNWFNNKLDIDEIDKLYNYSYYSDNNTIDLILSINSSSFFIINNENIDDINTIIELLTNYKNHKKYIINFDISHIGLYFYPKISCNKWLIKNINISNIDDTTYWNKEDIENEWYSDIQEINNSIDNELLRLNNIKNIINNLYIDIKNTSIPDNIWENKINLLKSIIIDPNNRILSIYDNR